MKRHRNVNLLLMLVLLVAVGQMAQTIYIPAIADMARDHIKNREIGADRLRKIEISGSCGLEREDLRKENHCRQAACGQGIDGKLPH